MRSFTLVLMLVFCCAAVCAQEPTAEEKAKAAAAAAKALKDIAEPSGPVPFWKANPPKVAGEVEKRYDINRDRILQSAEVKTLLRDVIEEVDVNKSYLYNVADSAVLKEYDKNKDGIIDNIEVKVIESDVGLPPQEK